MKQLYLTFISACLLLAAGCREEEGEFKPSTLTLNTPEVTVAADGGEVSVSYRLASPVYEGRITVGNVPEWISGVATSLSGVISFTVAANELTESRSAELSVRYSGDAETAVLRVVQSPRTVPPVFDIRMELITQTSAKYSVIPGRHLDPRGARPLLRRHADRGALSRRLRRCLRPGRAAADGHHAG